MSTFIYNLKKRKKIIILILLITICFFAMNITDLFGKLVTSITTILTNEKEIKTVEFTSSGYEDKETGNFKITKQADWTSKDTAQITWTVKSYIESNNTKKDIIIVLDTSASMNDIGNNNCTKLECSKEAITKFVKETLNVQGNQVALISFNNSATILSNFTKDESTLLSQIDKIQAKGDTNYNQALIKVGEILNNYPKADGRQVEVLFITDGYPNIDNPNQNVRYEELKNKYPFITIHGIQYEMGKEIINEIKKISDKQYSINTTSLTDILNEILFSPNAYEIFQIIDYIDNDYFMIESINDIEVDVGDIALTTDNNVQKVTWSSNEILTGNEYQLKIKIKLKDSYVGVKGLYPTNKREIITVQLPSNELISFNENGNIKLKAPYKVTYDANTPKECSKEFELEEEYFAFDTAFISDKQLECEGYQFKGWELEDVTKVTDNSFIMPTNDVILRGIWTKLELNKTMEGTVYEKLSLYKTIAKQAVPDNIKSKYVSSITGIDFKNQTSDTNGKGIYAIASTLNNEYPIYYFRGDIDNNHVLFANYCWEIIRTTETGGIKLIYDGKPVDGVCNNTGKDTELTTTKFNEVYNSIAYLGYMYNKVYIPSYQNLGIQVDVNKSRSNLNTTNYYYSSEEPTYNKSTGKYTLVNPKKYLWESNYSNLDGYYTCFSDSTTSCTNVFYIKKPSSNYCNYYEFKDGKVEYMTLGKNYVENNDGTYTLTNAFKIREADFDYSYVYNYMCADQESTTCNNMWYLASGNNLSYQYIDINTKYLYGNSYQYDATTKTYTLKDTFDTWNVVKDNSSLTSHHYTCLNATGTCKTIYYLISVPTNIQGIPVYFIELTNGESIKDALNNMLYAKDVNTNDSTVKRIVDDWFNQNLTNYNKYIEDTVYCNDRSIYQYGAYDSNGLFQPTYFNTYERRLGTPSLQCNLLDSFTVSTKNGNGSLKYPIGLITSDEVVYGGINSYLNTSEDYLTMSPYYSSGNYTNSVFNIGNNGLSNALNYNNYGVRPVISLKPDIEYSSGDGSSQTPYVIDLTSIE